MIIDNFFLQLANPKAWMFLLPLWMVFLGVRYFLYRPIVYKYSLVSLFAQRAGGQKPWFLYLLNGIKYSIFGLLTALVFEPQFVDVRSQLPLNGIDMVIVLDVSGSMQHMDYDAQKKSRIDVAKEEAIRFIAGRHNDAIGLVIFGNDAVSRCPITLDKRILKKMVEELYIGIVEPEGTVLARAIITAANRLKNAQSGNKVMIVLTDGEPSAGDLDIAAAIKVAKDVGIKVYTIGIGSETDEFYIHPYYGVVQKPKVNAHLLAHIAKETEGQFFMARNAQDMRTVYQTIDALEKTKHEAPIFGTYYDLLIPLAGASFCLMIIYLTLSTLMWFSL